MWNCSQYFDIDEQSIPYKGRHKYRCYNPSKPNKFHFKIYSLNDTHSYQKKFYFYQGKSSVVDAGYTATSQPIKTLVLDDEKFHNKGYILVTDNWYTSLFTLKELLRVGIHSLGTVKTNKQGLPKEKSFKKTGADKKERGEFGIWCRSVFENMRAYFIAWMDKKPVHLLSSFCGGVSTCNRMIKGNDGRWRRATIMQPTMVRHYNHGMGGTDGVDQLISYYFPMIKSKDWTKRVFVHLLMCSVVNAFNIYKWFYQQEEQHQNINPIQLVDFLEELIVQLAEDWQKSRPKRSSPNSAGGSGSKRKHRQIYSDGEHSRLNSTLPHTPVTVALSKDDYEELKEEAEANGVTSHLTAIDRNRCRVCKVLKPAIQCRECGVFLCVRITSNRELSCWEKFHTLHDYGGGKKRKR